MSESLSHNSLNRTNYIIILFGWVGGWYMQMNINQIMNMLGGLSHNLLTTCVLWYKSYYYIIWVGGWMVRVNAIFQSCLCIKPNNSLAFSTLLEFTLSFFMHCFDVQGQLWRPFGNNVTVGTVKALLGRIRWLCWLLGKLGRLLCTPLEARRAEALPR